MTDPGSIFPDSGPNGHALSVDPGEPKSESTTYMSPQPQASHSSEDVESARQSVEPLSEPPTSEPPQHDRDSTVEPNQPESARPQSLLANELTVESASGGDGDSSVSRIPSKRPHEDDSNTNTEDNNDQEPVEETSPEPDVAQKIKAEQNALGSEYRDLTKLLTKAMSARGQAMANALRKGKRLPLADKVYTAQNKAFEGRHSLAEKQLKYNRDMVDRVFVGEIANTWVRFLDKKADLKEQMIADLLKSLSHMERERNVRMSSSVDHKEARAIHRNALVGLVGTASVRSLTDDEIDHDLYYIRTGEVEPEPRPYDDNEESLDVRDENIPEERAYGDHASYLVEGPPPSEHYEQPPQHVVPPEHFYYQPPPPPPQQQQHPQLLQQQQQQLQQQQQQQYQAQEYERQRMQQYGPIKVEHGYGQDPAAQGMPTVLKPPGAFTHPQYYNPTAYPPQQQQQQQQQQPGRLPSAPSMALQQDQAQQPYGYTNIPPPPPPQMVAQYPPQYQYQHAQYQQPVAQYQYPYYGGDQMAQAQAQAQASYQQMAYQQAAQQYQNPPGQQREFGYGQY